MPTDSTVETPQVTEQETPKVTEQETGSESSGTVDDNQPVTLAEARRLRRENQKLRGENKDTIAAAVAEAAEAAARKAREEALAEAQAAREAERAEIGKALSQAFGIAPAEEDDTPPDPAVIAEQAISKATESEQRAAAAEKRAAERDRELAVFRLAGDADPHELLDSRSFMRSIREVDPNAENASELIRGAITRAVEANPRLLKTVELPSRSSADFSGGNGDANAGAGEGDDIDALRERRAKRRANNR